MIQDQGQEANGEQFKKVIAIVTAQPERQAVITSAPGKRCGILALT